MGIEPCYFSKVRYANGEISITFPESIKNTSVVFFYQQTKQVNSDLMELLIAIHAAKASGASKITIICPYTPYARQNQLSSDSLPTYLFLQEMLAHAGVHHWITLDLHEPVLACKSLSISNLSANNLLLESFKKLYLTQENWICIAADSGAAKKAHLFADALKMPFGFCKKIRKNKQVKIIECTKEVAQKSIVLIDDMIDTGKTLHAASTFLHQKGAYKIICAVTHGIISKKVFSKLSKSPMDGLIETDTLPILEKGFAKDLQIVSVAPLLAQKLKEILQKI